MVTAGTATVTFSVGSVPLHHPGRQGIMRIRTTAAAVVLAAATSLSLTSLAYAQGDDRNCADFGSQQEAQAALDAAGGSDPDGLDTDDNGQACEEFDYAAANSGDDADDTTDESADDTTETTTTAAPTPAPTPAPQVEAPRGGVDTGDGTTSGDALPGLLLLGGLTTLGAGAGAVALRRSARRSS